MEGPLAPGAANGSIRTPSPTPPAVDPKIIVEHLERILDVNLGATQQDLYAPGSLLSVARREDTLQRCSRFAAEGQSALYLVKNRAEDALTDGPDGANGRCTSKLEGATGLTTSSRHNRALHLHRFVRTHRFAHLRRFRCHFEAPNTPRPFDTPQRSNSYFDTSRFYIF
jgi:hypothetical protein